MREAIKWLVVVVAGLMLTSNPLTACPFLFSSSTHSCCPNSSLPVDHCSRSAMADSCPLFAAEADKVLAKSKVEFADFQLLGPSSEVQLLSPALILPVSQHLPDDSDLNVLLRVLRI